jgi:2-hydroxy-3-keto-5-methylthiopentenyl-1-phosphate phosphatase
MKLVVDWDGTATVNDSIWVFMERFGDQGLFERMEAGLGTTVSHRDVMERELATVKAPLDEVNAWLVENVVLRDGFAELVERFSPLILSMGFHETIEPILAREGIEVELIANRLEAGRDGWRVRWRDEADCPVCGDVCKRSGMPHGSPLVYVGDGYSDRCPAILADRIFARRDLAVYLDAQGIPYEPFETFHDVAAALP